MKEPRLFLHTKENEPELRSVYEQAITESTELYIVSAYLTEWDIEIPIIQILNQRNLNLYLVKTLDYLEKKL